MDITSSSKWKELKNEISVIGNYATYQKALELFYKEFGQDMLKHDTICAFITTYHLNNFHITDSDVKTDLQQIIKIQEKIQKISTRLDKIRNIIPTIDNYESYNAALKLLYPQVTTGKYDKETIRDFIRTYQIDTKLHITFDKVQNDLVKIKIKAIINKDSIDSYQSYNDALEIIYPQVTTGLDGEKLIQDFIGTYQLDTKLYISFDDVQYDLKKMKLKKEIDTITDIKSYEKALELYYDEFENGMFDKAMIQEFIDDYQLDTVLHIGFSDVWNDLAKTKFTEEIGVITDKQSYLESLELYYNEFDDAILFDEEIISKFINIYHLDTRFNISANDVWNDLAKIKRQSKLEDKLIEEIGTIEDAESYREALELYFNVFGEDMFEISKVQRFIDTFELYNIDITLNTVYQDLRAIKRAFESGNEISGKKTKSIQPSNKPSESTTPPVQSQTVNTTPPIQEQSRQNQNACNTFAEHNESFYSYVTHMSNTQLINAIDDQYKSIKGTQNTAPCMGEYGSIEFAAVLLLWRYATANFDRNKEAFASLQITLGDMICCAFFGMPAGEWSDKVDPILNTHSEILSYDEFGDVYNYLKDNLMDKIHSLEFNNGNQTKEVYEQIYNIFTQLYNSMQGFVDTWNFYTEKGLRIKNDIHFRIADKYYNDLTYLESQLNK